MACITPAQASDIVAELAQSRPILKRDGQPRKYSFRYVLNGAQDRHIAIASRDTSNEVCPSPAAGLTVYVAGTNCRMEQFPHASLEAVFPGVKVSKHYPQGLRGRTGDQGLSSAAASCETLNPMNNDVLRLCVADEKVLKRLLAWYASEPV
ncbi:MAG: hypothetical protein RJB60_2386 [Pseudomonadota bacterium]|jgi:hypothetical protein